MSPLSFPEGRVEGNASSPRAWGGNLKESMSAWCFLGNDKWGPAETGHRAIHWRNEKTFSKGWILLSPDWESAKFTFRCSVPIRAPQSQFSLETLRTYEGERERVSFRRIVTSAWLHPHIMAEILKETNPFASDFSPYKICWRAWDLLHFPGLLLY